MNLRLENRHPHYSLASTVQRALQRSCVSQRCSTHVSPHGVEVTTLQPWGCLVSFSDNLSFFFPSLTEHIRRMQFSSADGLSFTQVRSACCFSWWLKHHSIHSAELKRWAGTVLDHNANSCLSLQRRKSRNSRRECRHHVLKKISRKKNDFPANGIDFRLKFRPLNFGSLLVLCAFHWLQDCILKWNLVGLIWLGETAEWPWAFLLFFNDVFCRSRPFVAVSTRLFTGPHWLD